MVVGLYPLTTNEVAEMVAFRWHVASGRKKHPFTEEALLALFEASGGIPRKDTRNGEGEALYKVMLVVEVTGDSVYSYGVSPDRTQKEYTH